MKAVILAGGMGTRLSEETWSCIDTLREKNYLEELLQASKAPWKVW